MKTPTKMQAKLEKAEARAVKDLAALRAKAEKKIAKIQDVLRADEADVHARLEARRAKYTAKLERGHERGARGDGTPAIDRPRPKKAKAPAAPRRSRR